MEEAKSARLKIFLWDQLVRPVLLLLNIHQLQLLLLALLFLNLAVWKDVLAFFILLVLLAIIFFYEIYKYYKSGEFIHNYRKYKSDKGQYSDYRKLTKELKQEKQPLAIKMERLNKKSINSAIKKMSEENKNELEEQIHQDEAVILEEEMKEEDEKES